MSNITDGSIEPKVTVFILTVGDPAFELSEKAILGQTYKNVKYEIIKNVAPFNAACREMIKRSQTEYFIQVDEDMILFPDAVEKMVKVIDQTRKNVGMVCFHLYDMDRELKIQGIKIYRTSLLKQIEWRDLKASEIDILDQFHEKGIQWVLNSDIVGNHGVIYTPETIYLRYKTMYEKDLAIFNILPNDIYKKALRFKDSGDLNELFALLGSVHGIVNAHNYVDKEKDFRIYNDESLGILKRLFLQGEAPVYQIYKENKKQIVSKSQPILFQNISPKTEDEILEEMSIKSSIIYNKIQKNSMDSLVINSINEVIDDFILLHREFISRIDKDNQLAMELSDEISDVLVNVVESIEQNRQEHFYEIYIMKFIPTFELWKREIRNLLHENKKSI